MKKITQNPSRNTKKITPTYSFSKLSSLGITHGYFTNSIPNSVSEIIFTYPERYGLWGTAGFVTQVVADAQAIVAKGLNPVITLEPYKDLLTNPLPEIVGGTINGFLTNLFNGISAVAPNAIIRPMHEMETNQARYPWSNRLPADYIAAYRHLFTLNQGLSNNLKFLWTPAGDNSSPTYYVGDGFTDFVGFSLYETPTDVDLIWYGADRQLIPEFVRKMNLMPVSKQIIIPEIGIANKSTELKAGQLYDVYLKALSDYPGRISSVIYFNQSETLPGFTNLSYRI